MPAKSLKEWAQRARIDPTPVGDLIYDLRHGPALPDDIASLEQLESHLRRTRASFEALDAAAAVWRRYKVYCAHPRAGRARGQAPRDGRAPRNGKETRMSEAVGLLAGRRILVVEDEYLVAHDLARSLEAQGATIAGPVATVHAALRLVADATILDAALLDINLQGEMAFPVADALKERGVPFAFVTGYSPGIIPARHADAPRHEKPVAAPALAVALSA